MLQDVDDLPLVLPLIVGTYGHPRYLQRVVCSVSVSQALRRRKDSLLLRVLLGNSQQTHSTRATRKFSSEFKMVPRKRMRGRASNKEKVT